MTGYYKDLNSSLEVLKTGDKEKIKATFERLTKDYPQEFEPFYHLAVIEAESKNIQTALYYIKKALNILPFYDGYALLAKLYAYDKKKKKAAEAIKMALVYNPYDEELKELLNKVAPDNDFIDSDDFSIDGVYENSKDCPHIKYQKAYDSTDIKRKVPAFIETQFTENQKTLMEDAVKEYKKNTAKEGFVLEIQNGTVFAKQTDQTYFITPDHMFLVDMLDRSGPNLSVTSMPDVFRVCDNMLVLSSCYGGNFYHWLTWTVPRLQMILDAGYKLDDFDKILINFVGYPWQQDFLKMLNIPKSKIIGTLEKGAVLQAKNLVTASLPEYDVLPEIVTQSLRKAFLKPEYTDDKMPKRIYISREKSGRRHISNEKQLQEFLEKYGFTTINAEDYTFEEQIKFFANAKVVVSQHGAGLVNTAFCNPKTKVIEIYNENLYGYLQTCYWKISNDAGLKHYFMFGESEGKGDTSNMKVDLAKLQEVFDLAKIK